MKIGIKTRLSAAALLLSLWLSPVSALAQDAGASTAAPSSGAGGIAAALPSGLRSLIEAATESSCLLCDAYEQRPLLEIKAGFSALCNASLPEKHRLVQVNLVDTRGRSPLLLATKANDLEGVKFFLTNSCQGADVNIANHNGRTPLMWAAQHGNLEMVNALIEKRANVNAAKVDGTTVLDYAAVRNQHREVVYKLYTSGATVTANAETLKRLANSSGITDGKRIITDILLSGNINFPYGSERSLLIWSARNGETQLAEALVADGANKDTLDHLNSEKAYRVAVRAGHFETAGVIGPNDRPFNTFRYALTTSSTDLADEAEQSDHPNLISRGSIIPLIDYSIIVNNRALFDVQIADDADVNRMPQADNLYRSLGWAVAARRIDMAEILLKKGALLSNAGANLGITNPRHALEVSFADCVENTPVMIDWVLSKIDDWDATLNESTRFTLGSLLRNDCKLGRTKDISLLDTMVAKGLNLQSPVFSPNIYPAEYAAGDASFLLPRLLHHGASCSISRTSSTGPIFLLDTVDRRIALGRNHFRHSPAGFYDDLLRTRTTLEAHNCPRAPRPSSSAPEGGAVGESEVDTRQQERNEALDEVIRQLDEAMEEARRRQPRTLPSFPEGL